MHNRSLQKRLATFLGVLILASTSMIGCSTFARDAEDARDEARRAANRADAAADRADAAARKAEALFERMIRK